jgi:ABC-2 type transport system permease protein
MMSTTFGMIGFWSTQANNLYSLWFGAGQFLSGWIAPLALFPPGIRMFATWLPFRSTLGFPVEVLLGRTSGPALALGFLVSAGWILFFWIIYRVLWKYGLRRYESVGA